MTTLEQRIARKYELTKAIATNKSEQKTGENRFQ